MVRFNNQKTADRIFALAAQQNMTVAQLAQHLNCSPQALYKWKTGVCHPDLDKLGDICELFKKTTNEILVYDGLDLNRKYDEER